MTAACEMYRNTFHCRRGGRGRFARHVWGRALNHRIYINAVVLRVQRWDVGGWPSAEHESARKPFGTRKVWKDVQPRNTRKTRKGFRARLRRFWCSFVLAPQGEWRRWPTAEHESARKPASRDTKGGWTGCGGAEDKGVWRAWKAFVSAGMRRRTARGSEGRLHSNGVAARKGPRGFCVFRGSRLGRGLDLPQNTQKRPSDDTEEHRRELGRGNCCEAILRLFLPCFC